MFDARKLLLVLNEDSVYFNASQNARLNEAISDLKKAVKCLQSAKSNIQMLPGGDIEDASKDLRKALDVSQDALDTLVAASER